MSQHTLEKSTAYLCPRIVNVEKNYVYYGGDQAWLTRNSAYKGGCGPVCAANILTVYADRDSAFQSQLNMHINEKHFIKQDEYLALLQDLYNKMLILEVPLVSHLYNKLPRNTKLFRYIPCTFGTTITNFTQTTLRYAAKRDLNLQYRSLSAFFCGYTRGLTFIKLALANGYPVVLFATNSKYPCTIYDRPYLQAGTPKKISRHFVTITDIRESKDGVGPELIITTWGKTGRITYKELYRSWQSIRSFGSTLLYFTPAKNYRVTKRAILRSFLITFKR